jgi:hypothetical protein
LPSCSGVTIPSQGASPQFVTILSVSLPSGSYVITAKTDLAWVDSGLLDNPCQLVTPDLCTELP